MKTGLRLAFLVLGASLLMGAGVAGWGGRHLPVAASPSQVSPLTGSPAPTSPSTGSGRAEDAPRAAAARVLERLSGLPPHRLEREAAALDHWAAARGLRLQVALARPARGLYRGASLEPRPPDVALVSIVSLRNSQTLGHLLLWWQDGRRRFQLIVPSEKAFEGWRRAFGGDHEVLSARSERRRGRVEVAVVADEAARGSGSPRPVVSLLRLEGSRWRLLWSPPGGRAWRNSHGEVQFGGDRFEAFLLRSDSWQCGDDLDGYVHEPNAGPHRTFLDSWERRGDRFVRTRAETEASAYDTLLRFLQAVGRGDRPLATRRVTDPALVDRALAYGLGRASRTAGWQVELKAPVAVKTGPLVLTSGPAAAPVTFEFVAEQGAWRIRNLTNRFVAYLEGGLLEDDRVRAFLVLAGQDAPLARPRFSFRVHDHQGHQVWVPAATTRPGPAGGLNARWEVLSPPFEPGDFPDAVMAETDGPGERWVMNLAFG